MKRKIRQTFSMLLIVVFTAVTFLPLTVNATTPSKARFTYETIKNGDYITLNISLNTPSVYLVEYAAQYDSNALEAGCLSGNTWVPGEATYNGSGTDVGTEGIVKLTLDFSLFDDGVQRVQISKSIIRASFFVKGDSAKALHGSFATITFRMKQNIENIYDYITILPVASNVYISETESIDIATEPCPHESVTTKTYCTDKSVCLECGQVVSPATEHQFEKFVVPATCTADGYQYDRCKVCYYIDRSTNETLKSPGHSWNDGEVTTQPTCTKEGVKTFTCTVCSSTSTEPVDKVQHTPADAVEENRVAPTCTEYGSYDTVVYCSVCSAQISRETNRIDKTGHTPVSDAAVPATCKKAGKTAGTHCSVCNTTLSGRKTLPPTGHTVVNDPAVSATFTAAGKTAGSHCSVCGAVIDKQKPVAMLGAPVLTKVKKGKKRFTAFWSAVNGIDGYEIQYSTKKNMKKKKTVKIQNKTKRAVKKLKAKKKYYVRVRAYKTINGKVQYSAWSAKKKVKTK